METLLLDAAPRTARTTLLVPQAANGADGRDFRGALHSESPSQFNDRRETPRLSLSFWAAAFEPIYVADLCAQVSYDIY